MLKKKHFSFVKFSLILPVENNNNKKKQVMILRKTFIFHGWFFAQSLGYVIRQKKYIFACKLFFENVFFL